MALERHAGAVAVRALRSPAAIGLAVAGAGIGALAGLPLLAAAAVGAAGYGVGAALATALGGTRRRARPGGRGRERIDPFTLGEPWRLRVREALSARARYETAVERTPDGPLRERLVDIGARVDAGVEECWRIANQANELGKGLRSLGAGEARASLAAAEAAAGDGADADPRVAALRAQVASADRMTATAADADNRLRLLSARLEESAARAIELSLGAGTDADVAGLGSEVDEVVDQLESLRLALGEVAG